MLQLYTNNNQNTDMNGIILDSIAIKFEISNKLNGSNEAEGEFLLDKDGLYKNITRGALIRAPTPDFEEDQFYRVYETTKNMDDNTLSVSARHVFFDLSKKVIYNKTITMTNAQVALERLLEDTDFTAYSDITIQDIRQYKMRNLMNVLAGDDEDSLLSIFSGELSVNNYEVSLLEHRGETTSKIKVSFGYNLESIEETINADEVVTRIYPYISRSGDEEDVVLGTSTPYVDSPLISNYPDVYEEAIEMNDIKVKSEDSDSDDDGITIEEARKEMRKRCTKLFNNGADKIKANYKINMFDLSKTEEYKKLGYDKLQQLHLGDSVMCINKNIDIEVEARCISYKYDCINREFTSIELGDFISGYVDEQLKSLDNLYRKVVLQEQNILLRVDSLDNSMSAQIEIVKDGIKSCVTKDGVGSEIQQHAQDVQIAFNNISNYCKIDAKKGIILGNEKNGTYTWGGYDGQLRRMIDGEEKPYLGLVATGNVTINCSDTQDYNDKLVTLPKMFSECRDEDIKVIVAPQKVFKDGLYAQYWSGAYGEMDAGDIRIHAMSTWRNIDKDSNDYGNLEGGKIIVAWIAIA